MLAVSSINLSPDKFQFIPLQNFTERSDINWNNNISDIDKQLYIKYDLSREEIAFIEKMIKNNAIAVNKSERSIVFFVLKER